MMTGTYDDVTLLYDDVTLVTYAILRASDDWYL
jgi:hypothetical protein